MKARLVGWLREPLLHFLIAGAALFALSSWMSAAPDARVAVSAATVAQLSEGWVRARLRQPTARELDGLIEDHIREEIMYREALALGLDRDDTIIRRRLRQKLEFISDDLAIQAQPSDPELEAYLARHPDPFRQDPRYTFTHVFLNPERRGAALARDVERLLAELNGPAGPHDGDAHGDSFLLAFEFQASPSTEIAQLFGEEFAAAFTALPVGAWQGPIRSGYGMHLVLVRERVLGRVPALGEVREAVRREWAADAQRAANEAFYQRLRERYTVSVERPPTATTLAVPKAP